MVMVRIHPHTSARAAHPGWLVHMLADVSNSDLREAILAADRFAARIVFNLLGDTVDDLDKATQITPEMAHLLNHIDDDFLTILGQLWYAPVLATRVLGASGRAISGLDDRQTLRRLLTYRGHAQPTCIGPLPREPDYLQQGELCLCAWLDGRPDTDVLKRLRLTLPPPPVKEQQQQRERAALVDRVLSDPDLMGA